MRCTAGIPSSSRGRRSASWSTFAISISSSPTDGRQPRNPRHCGRKQDFLHQGEKRAGGRGRCIIPSGQIEPASKDCYHRGMNHRADALVLDFVEWIAAGPRRYSEVMEAWKTSCPRLTIWEDAIDQGLVQRCRIDGQLSIQATEAGPDLLAQTRPE